MTTKSGDVGQAQNPQPPSQTTKQVPQNDKGRRPDVAQGVDPSVKDQSVSSTNPSRNPEADLQDKDIKGQHE